MKTSHHKQAALRERGYTHVVGAVGDRAPSVVQYSMKAYMHKHLRRLDRVWIPHAVYFITICTHRRARILAAPDSRDILVQEWKGASVRHGWVVGRFVLMPDHVHFFCKEQASGATSPLSGFVGKWKEWSAKALIRKGPGIASPVWQKHFFDHVLRQDESYADKWLYVRENPVRAGLVKKHEDWPYQGFVDFDEPRAQM